MKHSNRFWTTLAGISFFLVAMGLAGKADYQDALMAQQMYCDNVKLFVKTSGKSGWPDYQKNFHTQCNEKTNN